MKMEHKTWLEERFGGMVRFDEPMSVHTTLGIGGPANIVTVKTDERLKELVQWGRENGVPLMILGAGSNLLVRDGGICGVVIRLANGFTAIELSAWDAHTERVTLSVGAGVLLPKLCRYALHEGLAGLNFAIGIPGTVGGAIRMNAGAWGESIADTLRSVTLLSHRGEIETVKKGALSFSYRKLALQEGTVILRSTFALTRSSPSRLHEDATRMLRQRRVQQPPPAGTAGCFFKNPSEGPSAGELIEKAGLKGARVGNAQISATHANFVVNKGGATAADVISLTRQAQAAVYEKFGVQLEREVIIVGKEATAKKSLQE
jgi:UDP-N-acetylmuramate dehydrogenase